MNKGNKKISMQDIADIVGVSKMTVSKCFQDNVDISEEMKKKVIDVAKEIGYVYTKKTKTHIMVLVPPTFLDSDEEFYSGLFKRLNEGSTIRNMVLTLIVVKSTDEQEIINHHNFEGIDGIIILGQLPRNFVEQIVTLKIPTICVDFIYRNINLDTITSNNFNASYNLTSYLIDHGHKEIGFVGKLNSTVSINDRYLGYYKALMENDLKLNEEYIIEDRNDFGEVKDIILPKKLPTAFVCNNDHVAYLLIEKLKSMNIFVPDDISVVGFDDVIYSIISNPKITTARVKRKYMAELALDLIERRIKSKNAEIRNITVECKLIERESVK